MKPADHFLSWKRYLPSAAMDMKKVNAVAKYAIFQSGRMGFIVE